MENTVVLILAGGKGSRLKSVVSDRPKPMALIGDVPFLHCLISRMCEFGFRKFCLMTGYMHDFIEDYFSENSIKGVDISFSLEDSPLGTAGAIRKALLLTGGESFVALNGDSYFGFSKPSLTQCLAALEKDRDKFIMALKKVDSPERYGVVDWREDDGQIEGFLEKGAVAGEAYINSGVYAFYREFLNEIGENDFSLENEVFPRLVADKKLIGIPLEGDFIDIGIPADYELAQNIVPLPSY